MRNFQQELKERIKKVNQDFASDVQLKHVHLYNVHKRSLPVGIDKPIIFGVTKPEGEALIKDFLKTEFLEQNGDTTIFYYDLVLTSATLEERSVYYNEPGKLIK